MAYKLLVTGATGFLGSHVAQHFHKLGYEVYAIGRNAVKGQTLEEIGIRFLQLDLTEEAEIVAACHGMDFIVHAAALSSPWGKYAQFYASNVTGTQTIIKGARLSGVQRVVHVSTPSIYFRFNDDEGFDKRGVREDQPLPKEKVNHYAQTKWLAEQEMDKAFRDGLPVITIRPRAIFGEGDNALMPKLLDANARIGVPLFHGGSNRMDLTYVGNVVHAIELCLFAPNMYLGEKYNITNGETVQFSELLHYTFQQMGQPFNKLRLPYGLLFKIAGMLEWVHAYLLNYKEPTLTKYSVSVLARTQTLNIDKARTQLGYKPQISVKEGIDRYVAWYKNQQKQGM